MYLTPAPCIEEQEMRSVYCAELIRQGQINDRIMAVDADLQYSVGTKEFYDKFPERGINCGIMEAHAVGLSAGLSAVGMIPFFHTFAAFASRRAYDQVFLSCAYQSLNVNIIGADPGITATSNGGTHMALEDIALFRAVPGSVIIEPADSALFKSAVEFMAEHYGLVYMRTFRRKANKIYKDGASFQIGKANLLKQGKDVALIACGIMVHEALTAAKLLKDAGIDAAVVDMHTIKPIDESMIIELAKSCGAVVTCENHNIIGGLGSAVAQVLTQNLPVPQEFIGVCESFGEVGTLDYLKQKFALNANAIFAAAVKCINRKGV